LKRSGQAARFHSLGAYFSAALTGALSDDLRSLLLYNSIRTIGSVMKYLNISDTRARLPALIDNLEREELVITRRGKPVAKLVRYKDKRQRKSRYPLRGLPLKVTEDFDESLPPLWEALE
jgi:antitoxin (DNA-binding transcriptional repressor) of toxin-antitoxin stability system